MMCAAQLHPATDRGLALLAPAGERQRWAAKGRPFDLYADVAMPKIHPFFILMLLLTLVTPTVAPAQGQSPDERARATEQQMTDDERFSLIISLVGGVPS